MDIAAENIALCTHGTVLKITTDYMILFLDHRPPVKLVYKIKGFYRSTDVWLPKN